MSKKSSRSPKTIKRTDILKYVTIKDKSLMANTEIAKHYDEILEKHPKIAYLETVWNEFHQIIMGNKPEELDDLRVVKTDLVKCQ